MSAPAAGQLYAALRSAVDAMEGWVASDCRWCDGEGTWTAGPRPRMVPVKHRSGCPYETARELCAQYEASVRTDEQWIEAMRSTPPDPPREGAARCPRCGIVVPLAILDRHEVAVTADGFDCAAYAPGADMGLRGTSRRCEATQ